jgi:hypothetical protein
MWQYVWGRHDGGILKIMVIVLLLQQWLFCPLMTALQTPIFTAERYVYWNVLHTVFWDRETWCVLRHKLAYCIATMRTLVVILVYWPFQGPSPRMRCHILLWWYSSAWVLKKNFSISDFVPSLSTKKNGLLSHNSVFLPWQNYSWFFPLPIFLSALAPIRAVFTQFFFWRGVQGQHWACEKGYLLTSTFLSVLTLKMDVPLFLSYGPD